MPLFLSVALRKCMQTVLRGKWACNWSPCASPLPRSALCCLLIEEDGMGDGIELGSSPRRVPAGDSWGRLCMDPLAGAK